MAVNDATAIGTEAAPVAASDLLAPEGTRLLYVGPPKTGTSSIQSALFTAREATRSQGVRYAGTRAHSAAAFKSVLARRTFRSQGAPTPPHAWRRLLKEVTTAREPRVVLSSEYLAGIKPDEIRRIVADLDPARVHVVFTLRPLPKILPSQWQQDLRNGTTTTYPAWLREVLDPERPATTVFWNMHRDDRAVARWVDAVGQDRVTAIVVDENDHDFSIRAFERLLGLRTGTLVSEPELGNRSMTRYEAEAMRALNHEFQARGIGKAQQHTIGHAGVAYELRMREVAADEPRIETPQWALDRAGEIASEMVQRIAASGIRVVGDLDSLGVTPTARIAGDGPDITLIPPELAARMAMGALIATGAIRRGPGDKRPPLSPATLDFTGVPTRRLMSTLLHRVRRKVTGGVLGRPES